VTGLGTSVLKVVEMTAGDILSYVSGSIERIVLLDFIHRLVSKKTNKIEELKI
jgi:hypothetical protein